MEKRRLGRLEHTSSVLLYGGAALAEVSEEQADESIAFALESGINHFDTAADYGDSELHLGRWVPRIRSDVFLATKTTERSKSDAAMSIRRSLERLRVDRVDLIQLHAIGDLEELDKATRAGGALEAAVDAKEEELVGGIGITGHGMGAPATHLEALRRYPFDTVLTPFSYRLSQDAGYKRGYDALMEEIEAQDAGLMLIKAVARNLWPNDERPRFTTWYEPLEEQRTIDAAVAFALSQKRVTGICTAGDVRLLPMHVEAEKKSAATSMKGIDRELSQLTEYEPPFVSSPGRTVPSWL